MSEDPIKYGKDDPINHPAHYTRYPIEVIDMMVRVFGQQRVADYCLINAFKYRMRAGIKTDDPSGDLAKEKWYLERYKDLKEDDGKKVRSLFDNKIYKVNRQINFDDRTVVICDGWPGEHIIGVDCEFI